jgi:hypothetical protein
MFEQWLESSNVSAQSVRLGKKAPPASDYSKGRWIRTLNGQDTCYLYIHTTTYQMQGNRPDDFVSEGDDAPKAVRLTQPLQLDFFASVQRAPDREPPPPPRCRRCRRRACAGSVRVLPDDARGRAPGGHRRSLAAGWGGGGQGV